MGSRGDGRCPGAGFGAIFSEPPMLGLVRLAGGFPAVAGQAADWRRRAALGALGYWWLTLSEPLQSGAPGAAAGDADRTWTIEYVEMEVTGRTAE